MLPAHLTAPPMEAHQRAAAAGTASPAHTRPAHALLRRKHKPALTARNAKPDAAAWTVPAVRPSLLHSTQRRARTCAGAVAQPSAQTNSTQQDQQDPAELLRELAGEELGYLAMGPTALGRGLVTKEPVIKQAIVSIPILNSLCLTDEPLSGISVFGDRLQEQWQQKHGRLPDDIREFLQGEERWDIRLTAWLLYVLDKERQTHGGKLAPGGHSMWSQYLALLPPEHEMCCLLNYDAEEAKELQLPQLLSEQQAQRVWSEYCHGYYFSKEKGRLALSASLEDTLWACAMVRSRTFSESINGEGITLMVPFADLANHSFSHNSTFCVGQSRQNFELRSVTHIDKGEEAAITYGESKCSYQLQRDYGFTVPGNPNDRIPLMPCPVQKSSASSSTDSISSSSSSNGNEGEGNASSSNKSEDVVGFSCPEDSQKAVFRGHRLNGQSLVAAAGMCGEWMKGELYMLDRKPQDGSSSNRWESEVGNGVFWSRQRSAVLSLPLTDGYGARGGAASTSQPDEGGFGKGLLSWLTKPRTDSGAPPPRDIMEHEVGVERGAVQEHMRHMQSLLDSLPTTAAHDQALLDGHAAATAGNGSPTQRLSDRHVQAVRCRLEWKRLVGQGLAVLQAYLESLS